MQAHLACIIKQRPTFLRTGDPSMRIYTLAIPPSISLQAGDGGASGLRFDFKMTFEVVPHDLDWDSSWTIHIRAYLLRILDRDEREFLVYHWQPGPSFAGPDFPHLNVSASPEIQVDALTRRTIDLDKRHLATGQVSFRSVIRMLITEFQIKPLRPDWETRLEEPAAH